jgi:hypothetical protein
MHAFERRASKRYVIDGLLMEIAGVVHETVDISTRAVAVVRRPGVDYTQAQGPFRFKCANARELNRPVSAVKYLYERAATVVLEYVILEYEVDRDVWESILSRHDVRSDIVPLEDVFG